MRDALSGYLATTGDWGLFAGRAIREAFRPPFEFRETPRQLFELGMSLDATRGGRRFLGWRRALDAHQGVTGTIRGRGAHPGWTRHRAGAGNRTAGRRSVVVWPHRRRDRRRAWRHAGHRADRRTRSVRGRLVQVSRRHAHGGVRDRAADSDDRDELHRHARRVCRRDRRSPGCPSACTSPRPFT